MTPIAESEDPQDVSIRDEPTTDHRQVLTTPQQWRGYLRDHSALYLLLKAADERRFDPDPERVASGWMGYPAATEDSIAAAEQRLGVRFPPSYRSFLLTTDGWDGLGGWIARVFPCAETYWMRDSGSGANLIDIYEEVEQEEPDLDDEDKYSLLFRRALVVTGGEDFWLLDPTETGPDGEWPAYLFTPKYGDLDRFACFSELFHDDRGILEQFTEPYR